MRDAHLPFMKQALLLAKKAAKKGEVPIGALLEKNGRVIAKAFNLTRTNADPTAHAEIVVLRLASKILKNERLSDTALYVTLEPCAMCAGAVIQARIPLLVYGAEDPKAGACGSVLQVIPNRNLNHRPQVIRGVLADESASLLRSFFRRRRNK